MFLCRIATEQLGITVRLTCGECQMYGVCDRVMCPKCNWVDMPANGCCKTDPQYIWVFKENFTEEREYFDYYAARSTSNTAT